MKTWRALSTALLIGAVTLPAFAQDAKTGESGRSSVSSAERYSRVYLKKACVNYLASLKSPNDGVVESAIAKIAHMKAILQRESFCDLKGELARLSASGRTPSIRYKAYLAAMLLDNPDWFKEECCKQYTASEELLDAISKKLQKTLLGYAGNES